MNVKGGLAHSEKVSHERPPARAELHQVDLPRLTHLLPQDDRPDTYQLSSNRGNSVSSECARPCNPEFQGREKG